MPLGRPHFDVHPSLVYQLGESLISDAVQALIELVKNSYDADASYSKVIIDTEGKFEVDGTIFPTAKGRIIVEDDGVGMSEDDIRSGWLTISNRKKRELKLARRTTPGGRTPLGDKGLGRLGVQRLGENLEIFTKAENQPGYHFGFSWLDFATAPSLQDVDIHLEEAPFPRRHGTRVVVSNLHEVETLRGQDAISRLESELALMISPYKRVRHFVVNIEVDGKRIELVEISDTVRSIAPITYSLNFDGRSLRIKGKAGLEFFRPQNQDQIDEYILAVESDRGETFFEFLKGESFAGSLSLKKSNETKWFVEFSWEKELEALDKVERLPSGELANPGPFTGEIDSFDLGRKAFQQQSVFDRISEYRRHIKGLSGIRVYRDGFAIRVGHDWLSLGGQWTAATSYYGMKPDNTLGYIALSARDNIELEETTDREGFKETPYFRNFFGLLRSFIQFTERTHNFFGRAWVSFRKFRNEQFAQLDPRQSIEELSGLIKSGLAAASQHQTNIESIQSKLKASVTASKIVSNKLRSTGRVTTQLKDQVEKSFSDLQALLEEAQSIIAELSAYLEQIKLLRGMEEIVEDRVKGLRNQVYEMYDAIALGLTAEALSHEIFNVADLLARRAKATETKLKRSGALNAATVAFIEQVHSAVSALRKQISFLSPSLRYVREQRNAIPIAAFLEEICEFYTERLSRNRISVNLFLSGPTFEVNMNKGKLTQIVDNFILNSEYWLKEDISQGRRQSGVITLEVDRPFLRIFDNGSGIDPSVEHALFEPFISAKANGRGLGLFIIKQLLDSEGCSVGLVPERNEKLRLFKFQMDFRGVIS